MDIKVVLEPAYDAATVEDMVVIGVFDDEEMGDIAYRYNFELNGFIAKRIADGDFSPKLGNTFTEFYTKPRTTYTEDSGAVRIALIGLGKQAKFDRHAFNKAAEAVASIIKGRKFASVLVRLVEQVNTQYGSALDALRELTMKLRVAQYSFNAFKSKAEPVDFPASITVTVHGDESITFAQDAVNTGEAIAAGMAFTKDLGNTPANVCTPTWLANEALKLDTNVIGKPMTSVNVLGLEQIKSLGMNSFLSVAQGSVQEPKFIVIQYCGAEDSAIGPNASMEAPIVLVGKGITFDTGGISIKPSSGMNEMKYDMLGAGTVLGAIKAIQQIGLKKNVIGIIPACENMPSGNAVKPGDIVTSMSGITIENNNTDAEGRLILCDALTFAQKNLLVKPELIIDMATLTGAICVSLGEVHSGLFTKDDTLAKDLIAAGYGAMDTVWRMPMDKEYDDMLSTNHADVANVGGRDGGSSSAACFLGRFVEDGTVWAHLDIAGTASTGGKNKAATGRPVPLIVQFLLNKAN
jgi:leucyl aminopeptidase